MLDTETLWTAPGHVIARWRNVFLQLRARAMTLEVLGSIDTAARLTRVQMPRGEPYGAMFVILPGAPPVTGESAVRQRELLAKLGHDERLHTAVVLEGDGVGVIAQRVMARAILRTKRRRICHTVPEAARVILAALGAPPREDAGLIAFVESLRERLEPRP